MAFEDKTRLPFIERPDLSPFIVHLTKRSTNGTSGFKNLISILKTGIIRGSRSSTGFIKGTTPAACFMDVPLGSLKYVLSKANSARYEPYGVVISKSWAYAEGARPVLYLSQSEQSQLCIPQTDYWRVVRFDGVSENSIGWIHEREWRAKGDFELPPKMLAVLVKNPAQAESLLETIAKSPSAFKAVPMSVLPLRIVCQGLPY